MKVYVPDYYKEFHCIAGACKHTCCQGWEVEIDEDSLGRFEKLPDIKPHISYEEEPHIQLLEGEKCPFLQEDGLCRMIVNYGEEVLCQTCRDHPRFRNYWEDRIEMGLGLVCEEAARLILGRKESMKLVILWEDETPVLTDAEESCSGLFVEPGTEWAKDEISKETDLPENLPEEEAWLMEYRESLLREVKEEGPLARFREYLIYRHIPNALYEDDLEERVGKIEIACEMLKSDWTKTDGSTRNC